MHVAVERGEREPLQAVRQLDARARILDADALSHGKILRPAAELDPRTGERVVACDDRGVERGHQRRVQEIEKICNRGAEPLDTTLVEVADRGDERIAVVAAGTGV